jgi:hypothetical protein
MGNSGQLRTAKKVERPGKIVSVSASSSDQADATRPTSMAAPPAFRCEPRFFAFGFAWLAAGFVVYTIARPPTVIAFLPRAPSFIELVPSQLRPLLGPAPTFVHVLAFSLMTASVVGRTQKRRLFVCAGWAAIEIAFELAQYPASRHWLLDSPASISSIPYVRDYLLGGTFDCADVLAAILGAALAGLFLTPIERGSQ